MMGLIILVIIIVIALLLLTSCIKIVPQAKALVIERLGAYQATWSVGLHFKLPIIERVARRVDLKEQVVDFAPQPVITKDNVTMRIDTVVFYQITDPKMFCYGVANPIMAIENLTATTLRNIIGDLELDQTLTSRETINTKMRASLDVATDPWGIKVNRVELKNIIAVISTEVCYHDVAPDILTEFHPWMNSVFFVADPKLIDMSKSAVDKLSTSGKVVWGRMVTGESFITDESRQKINDEFAPLTVDMETASIAHVCYANDIPFIAIRCVTDTEKHSGVDSFDKNCAKASSIAKDITVALLREIKKSW